MNPLEHLASLLKPGLDTMRRPLEAVRELDDVIDRLKLQMKRGPVAAVPADAQREAIARFWQDPSAVSLRDARLVSFSMDVPHADGGDCVLDDARKTEALLQAVDGWRHEPRRFRRCYQGLVRSYFSFDAEAPEATPVARGNRERLRTWLAEGLPWIKAAQGAGAAVPEPDWVRAAIANGQLFGRDPAEPYAGSLLAGDSRVVDALCLQLGIAPSSWFLRELTLAQLREAVKLNDAGFLAVLDRMLELLGRNPVSRDRGVAMMLDRHAAIRPAAGTSHPVFHRGLHNAAVLCWGNPWLAEDDARWTRVGNSARAMVARWLKLELIDTFFAEFSEDRQVDTATAPRRAAFWKRYVDGLGDLRITLPSAVTGPGIAGGHATDTPLLRRKLAGLVATMQARPAADAFDTALLMTFDNVVIVEFGRQALGLQGYSDRSALPFDVDRPLSSVDPAPNTLRHPSRSLSLQHRDGVRGWATWEQMFEALLKQQYGLEPGGRRTLARNAHVDLSIASVAATPMARPMRDEADLLLDQTVRTGLSAHWQTAEAGAVAFGRAELAIFARVHSLKVDDETIDGGKLWVRTGADEGGVSWVLSRWGFVHQPGQGWFRA